jgi:hypothetical protein
MKSIIKSHKLKKNTAETPNIRFLIIHFILPNLWCHYARCAYFSTCQITSLSHELRYSKVPNLQLILRTDENILTFQISVQDSLIMYIFDS